MTAIMINGDMYSLIFEKKREIRERYKMHIRISDAVAIIIQNSICDTEELLGLGKEGEYIKKDKPDIIRGLNRQKPRIVYRKTAKTVQIEDDVYFLIMDKQRDILQKYGVNITISQIIDALLKNYIYKIEEFFHIKV